jgi:hypothetical protein
MVVSLSCLSSAAMSGIALYDTQRAKLPWAIICVLTRNLFLIKLCQLKGSNPHRCMAGWHVMGQLLYSCCIYTYISTQARACAREVLISNAVATATAMTDTIRL